MAETRDLYQEAILDHYKVPRNHKRPASFDRSAEGYNRLCGDHVSVFLKLENNRIGNIAFEGDGCAISTASASMMTESVKGKTEEEAAELFRRFHYLLTSGESNDEKLGKLRVFAGVRAFPMRVKCATLAWHTLTAALRGIHETVSTE